MQVGESGNYEVHFEQRQISAASPAQWSIQDPNFSISSCFRLKIAAGRCILGKIRGCQSSFSSLKIGSLWRRRRRNLQKKKSLREGISQHRLGSIGDPGDLESKGCCCQNGRDARCHRHISKDLYRERLDRQYQKSSLSIKVLLIEICATDIKSFNIKGFFDMSNLSLDRGL